MFVQNSVIRYNYCRRQTVLYCSYKATWAGNRTQHKPKQSHPTAYLFYQPLTAGVMTLSSRHAYCFWHIYEL